MLGTGPRATPLVAVLDRCNDTSDLLKTFLKAVGCRAVGGQPSSAERGQIDWAAFIRTHEPHYIILDIAQPYHADWHAYLRLRADGVLAGRGVVVTTSHKKLAMNLAGGEATMLKVLEKPYSLDALVDALQQLGLRISRQVPDLQSPPCTT